MNSQARMRPGYGRAGQGRAGHRGCLLHEQDSAVQRSTAHHPAHTQHSTMQCSAEMIPDGEDWDG
jgi:hypothetical protein